MEPVRVVASRVLGDPGTVCSAKVKPANLDRHMSKCRMRHQTRDGKDDVRDQVSTMSRITSELHAAIEHKNADEVQRVLESGPGAATVHGSAFGSPLHHTINSAITGLFKPPGGGQGRTLVEEDAQPGIVRLLLAANADVRGTDEQGLTPLLLSARIGCAGALEVLLQANPDLSQRSPDGHEAIHLAALNDAVPALTLLLAAGVDADRQNAVGNTPLNIAVSCGWTESARYLLEHGANANIANRDDYYPLHWAAFDGNLQLGQLLLDHLADATLKDDRGHSPSDEARRKGHSEMVDLLERGAASGRIGETG